MWISFLTLKFHRFGGQKVCKSFYNIQQTPIPGTTRHLSKQPGFILFPLLFPRKREVSTLLFSTIHHVCRLGFCTCWKPSLPQPERFLPRCRASSCWWTGVRAGKEGAGDTHRLGNRRMLCSSDLTSASGTAREGAPSASTGDLTGRGRRKTNIPPAPREARVHSQPVPTWISVLSHTLSLPLFHGPACLLSPLIFLLHDGFISGVQACPNQGEPTVATSVLQENSFP